MDSETRTAGGDVAPSEVQKLRVFLSYSRKDSDFIVKLAPALEACGYLADFDLSTHDAANVATGISAEDEWWKRLQEMIQAADVMVFVVSPDSAASKVCDEEIAFARSLGKRVIAVLRREINFATAPPRLAALNVKIAIVGDDLPVFDAGVAQLCAALDRDVVWLREQTRLVLAAADWEQSGKREDELLRGAEISEAEAWSARRPLSAPEVPESVLAFLAASREAQAAREAAARRQLGVQRWLQRGVLLLIVIAMGITAAGGWFVLRGQQDLSVATSATLAASAAQASDAGEYDRAVRLAIIAARETWRQPSAAEASFELARATWAGSLEAMLPPASYAGSVEPPVRITTTEPGFPLGSFIETISFSDDGERLVLARETSIGVASAGPGGWRYVELIRDDTGQSEAVFEPGGRRLLTTSGDGDVRIWTERDGVWRPAHVGEEDWPKATWASWLHGGAVVAGNYTQTWIAHPSADGKWSGEELPAPAEAQGPGAYADILSWLDHAVERADGKRIIGQILGSGGVMVWTQAHDGVWSVHKTKLPLLKGTSAPDQEATSSTNVTISADGRWVLNAYQAGSEAEPKSLAVGYLDLLEVQPDGSLRLSQTFVADEGVEVVGGSLSASGERLLVRMSNNVSEMWIRRPNGAWGLDDELPGAAKTPTAYFSFDGERVVSQDAGEIQVWSPLAGGGWTVRTMRGLKSYGHPDVSADGRRLVTSGATGAQIWRLDGGPMGAPEVGPEGNPTLLLAGGDDDHKVMTDAAGALVSWTRGKDSGGTWRTLVEASEKPRWYVSNPAGTTLVFNTKAGEAVLWREGDGWRRQALPGSDPKGCEPVVAMDGRTVACSGSVSGVTVWWRDDAGTWRERVATGGTTKSEWVSFAPDGRLMAFRREGAKVLTPDATGWLEQAFQPAVSRVFGGVFGPDETLATVSHDTRAGAQIWRRDADGAYVQELSMPGSIGHELPAFSADGSTVAIPTGSGVMVARRDGGAKASDEKWRAVQTLIPETSISSIAVLSDGRSVVTLGRSGVTKVWSERADGGWSSTEITTDDSSIAALNLTPDGRSLILDDGWASVKADLSVFVTPRAELVAAACAVVLGGREFADSTGKGPVVGPRRITAGDVAAAPILRGREGEDVCAWKPARLDRWLDMALGWLN